MRIIGSSARCISPLACLCVCVSVCLFVSHEFAPAMNHYIRSTLGFKTDLQYNLFGAVHPWDSVGDTYREDTGGAKLRRAMAQNPYMHVLTQSGAQHRCATVHLLDRIKAAAR